MCVYMRAQVCWPMINLTQAEKRARIYHSNGNGMAVNFVANAYSKRWLNHANYSVIGRCQKQSDLSSGAFANSNNKKYTIFFKSSIII